MKNGGAEKLEIIFVFSSQVSFCSYWDYGDLHEIAGVEKYFFDLFYHHPHLSWYRRSII